jgi:hypothetical protein
VGEALSHTFVRWDGKGVPRRIASEGLPMSVRLMQLADTTRFPNGFEHVVKVRGTPVGLTTFQPGWRWSNDVRPLMGTDSCPLLHTGFVLSGRLYVRMNDGSALDLAPGEVFEIPPGHDAWVVGDDPCRLLDWGGKVRESTCAGAAPRHLEVRPHLRQS